MKKKLCYWCGCECSKIIILQSKDEVAKMCSERFIKEMIKEEAQYTRNKNDL